MRFAVFLFCLLIFSGAPSVATAQSSALVEAQTPTPAAKPIQDARQRNLSEVSSDMKPEVGKVVSARSLWLIFAYSASIMLASVIGGYIPTVVKLTHTTMQIVISVVGGLMLGIAIFHLLPHATTGLSIQDTAWWMMVGIVTMFLLIRWFHFHHHGPLEISTEKEDPCAGHDHDDHRDHSHDHDHDHVHQHEHDHSHERQPENRGLTQPFCHHAHELSWMGIAIGLSLHTLIDGMALAASVQAPMTRPSLIPLAGFGTFLAILLHKPLDAVSITSLMASSGWKSTSRLLVNLLFATMCPIGAMLFLAGMSRFSGGQNELVCSALAFSAGVFLCISLSDLLPEMEFHSHNQLELTLALLSGILIAYGITFLH